MSELKARNVMSKEVLVVEKGTLVKEVAKLFTEKKIGGAPVVDENGKLVGIVTEGDLIMQDVRIHFPTYIHLLDGFIFLQSFGRFERELKKAVGARAEDVMTPDVVTVSEDTPLEEIATLMVEKDVSRLPVLRGDKIVGMVTKGDIVRAIARD
ncbi:MAG TPA: hypothetical protein DCW86_00800 [Actinobacteria bacterium]|nr:hypothetical protein [Actinomycetota bacterium]